MTKGRWIKVYLAMLDNPKVAACTDTEHRAYMTALLKADYQQPPGEWRSRKYLAAALGDRLGACVPALIERELIAEDAGGRVSIAQWAYWQDDDRSEPKRAAGHVGGKVSLAGAVRNADGTFAPRSVGPSTDFVGSPRSTNDFAVLGSAHAQPTKHSQARSKHQARPTDRPTDTTDLVLGGRALAGLVNRPPSPADCEEHDYEEAVTPDGLAVQRCRRCRHVAVTA